MGANAISRPQTQRDLLRMSVQVKAPPFDSVRRWQTPEMGLNFPDTEEVYNAYHEASSPDLLALGVRLHGSCRRRQPQLAWTRDLRTHHDGPRCHGWPAMHQGAALPCRNGGG